MEEDKLIQARITAKAHLDSIVFSCDGDREKEIYILSHLVTYYVLDHVKEDIRDDWIKELMEVVKLIMED